LIALNVYLIASYNAFRWVVASLCNPGLVEHRAASQAATARTRSRVGM